MSDQEFLRWIIGLIVVMPVVVPILYLTYIMGAKK